MSAGFPSGTNTFVPSFETSGHLTIAYSRNPKTFALNEYITIVPVKKNSGYYLRITAENAARVLSTTGAGKTWADGDAAPTGEWERESNEFKQFATIRYAEAFRLGYLTEQQADWKIEAYHAAMAAQQMMTLRTLQVQTKLATSGNYDTGHSDTATNWGGGAWDAGSSNNPYIQQGLLAMVEKINIDTLGVVSIKDLVLVLSPKGARKIAKSQEIHDYVKGSPFVEKMLTEGSVGRNAQWGLPDMLYGVKVVVDDTVRVTSAKGATKAADYVQTYTEAYLVSRPGGIVGVAGAPSFGAVSLFMKEEMTVETKDDPDNRRKVGRVVEDYDVGFTSPAAVCRATAIVT